jgi:type II secretory pathway pseudopilin PulG
MKKNIKLNLGFTLFELLVAMFIFMLLLGTIMGIYVLSVKHMRKQLNSQTLQQDVQNLFETLDREVRTAYGNTFFPLDPSSPDFTFVNQAGSCITYKTESNQAKRFEYAREADGSCNSASATSAIVLHSNRTVINGMAFNIVASGVVDEPSEDDYLTGEQGKVSLSLKACPRDFTSDADCINFQTSVASRQIKPVSTPAP